MAGEVAGARNGITYGWDLGDSTWKAGNDASLKKIDAILQLSVIDRDLSTPPGTPANGDTYIVGDAPTGDWAANENDIALYITADLAWYFLTPVEGWLCYIKDEDVFSTYSGAVWTKGIRATEIKSVADRDLTAPPGTPADGDTYIVAATATGDWAGEETNIARYNAGATTWVIYAPVLGDTLYAVDEAIWIGWNGTAWVAV